MFVYGCSFADIRLLLKRATNNEQRKSNNEKSQSKNDIRLPIDSREIKKDVYVSDRKS